MPKVHHYHIDDVILRRVVWVKNLSIAQIDYVDYVIVSHFGILHSDFCFVNEKARSSAVFAHRAHPESCALR
jgi:hypothetical protein